MNRNLRLGMAGLLIVAFGAAAVWLTSGKVEGPVGKIGEVPSTVGKGPMTLANADACRACHPEIWAEWKKSHHGFAWLNPEPRRKELSDNFKNRDCIPCHAPRPMLEVGGVRPLEREENREDGVDCFTCHRYQNVHAAANPLTKAADSAPCNPVPFPPISDMLTCAPCHDQHKVKQDWLQTEYAQEGPTKKDCNDCHMPVVQGPGTVGGPRPTHRSHLFPAAHDADMLKTSATVDARSFKDNDGVLWIGIEIKNTGVGHNLPADERHRAVDLVVQFRGPDGGLGEAKQLVRFRNPYRHEFDIINPFKNRTYLSSAVDWDRKRVQIHQLRLPPAYNPNRRVWYPESTQLMAGEGRAVFFRAPYGEEGAVDIKLIYKLTPITPDAEGVVINHATIDFATKTAVAAAPQTSIAPYLSMNVAPEQPAGASVAETDQYGAALRADATAALVLDESAPMERRLAAMESLEDTPSRAIVEALLLVMKDKSQQAFVMDPSDGEGGYRVMENPFGGLDVRAPLRWTACETVGRLGLSEALPDVVAAFEDRHFVVRNHAAKAAWQLGSLAGLPVLLKSLEEKAFQNETANRILKEITEKDAGFDTDIGFTRKAEAIGRWKEIVAGFRATPRPMPRRGDNAVLDRRLGRIVEIMGEHQFLFMENSRRILSFLGDLAVDHLELKLKSKTPPNQQVRAYAAHCLASIAQEGNARARDLLLDLIVDKDAAVRMRAVEALTPPPGRASSEKSIVTAVILRLDDADPSVVVAAVRALGRLGVAESATRLERMFADQGISRALRAATAESLVRLKKGGGGAGSWLMEQLERGAPHEKADVITFIESLPEVGAVGTIDPTIPLVDQPEIAAAVRRAFGL